MILSIPSSHYYRVGCSPNIESKKGGLRSGGFQVPCEFREGWLIQMGVRWILPTSIAPTFGVNGAFNIVPCGSRCWVRD